MTFVLDCPCGTRITGEDEDRLVAAANTHLEAAHPGRDYTRDEILFMSYEVRAPRPSGDQVS